MNQINFITIILCSNIKIKKKRFILTIPREINTNSTYRNANTKSQMGREMKRNPNYTRIHLRHKSSWQRIGSTQKFTSITLCSNTFFTHVHIHTTTIVAASTT